MTKQLVAVALFFCLLSIHQTKAQGIAADSVKQMLLNLDLQVQDIQLNIKDGHKQFKTGIIVSTIGYSVTIAGGLMLGRENDQLGQALLIAGGATGLTGTFLMADAFAVMAGKKRKRKAQ